MRGRRRGIKGLSRPGCSATPLGMSEHQRFSPSAGWDDVRAQFARHRQALVALAGAFFLLPTLAFSYFGPLDAFTQLGPDPAPEEAWAAIGPLVPWILVFAVVQMIGQLAVLAAITRSGTVGEAIRVGFMRIGYLILANIVFFFLAMAAMLVAIAILGVLAAVGGPIGGAISFVGAILVMGLYLYLYVRFLLPAVLLVAQEARSPFVVLSRSWAITRGNAFPIAVFYLIVVVVFLVALLAASFGVGLVLGLAGLDMTPGGAGASIMAVVNGAISAIGSVIFLLMQLAVYRQLARPGGGHPPSVR